MFFKTVFILNKGKNKNECNLKPRSDNRKTATFQTMKSQIMALEKVSSCECFHVLGTN